jgi:hypothetical protein
MEGWTAPLRIHARPRHHGPATGRDRSHPRAAHLRAVRPRPARLKRHRPPDQRPRLPHQHRQEVVPATSPASAVQPHLHRRTDLPRDHHLRLPRENRGPRRVRRGGTPARTARREPLPPGRERLRLPRHRQTPVPAMRQGHDRNSRHRPQQDLPLLHLLDHVPLRHRRLQRATDQRRRPRTRSTRRDRHILPNSTRPHGASRRHRARTTRRE